MIQNYINLIRINNSFSLRRRMKGVILCFIITFYFSDSKTNVFTTLDPFSSSNILFSLFPIADPLFSSCSSGKRNQSLCIKDAVILVLSQRILNTCC